MSNGGDPPVENLERLEPSTAQPVFLEPIAPSLLAPASEAPRVPRREGWRALGLMLLAVVIATGIQVLAGAVIGFSAAISGSGDFARLAEFFSSPNGFMLMVGCAQIGFLIVAVRAARVLQGPRLRQLGFAPAGLSLASYAAFLLGTIFCAIVGTILAIPVAVLIPAGDVTELWKQIDLYACVPFVLVIALGPGFCEEVFFRGVLQRRLLRHWAPAAAILWASTLFALAHALPSQVVFAFPIGIWLGIIAWRTGSIWPTVVCHAGVNGLWNIYFISVVQLKVSESAQAVTEIIVAAAALVGFLASIAILAKRRPPPIDEPAEACAPTAVIVMQPGDEAGMI